MKKIFKNEHGIAHLFLLIGILLLIAAVGGGAWRVNEVRKDKLAAQKSSEDKKNKDAKAEGNVANDTAKPAETANTPATNSQPKPAAKPTPSAPTTTPTKPAVPAPTVSSTNCTPTDASVYARMNEGKKSSEFMLNGYSPSGKFKEALEFAGLLATVDSKKVVVFTPNDYVFDSKLSAAQKAFMYQSPDNMRSVLGWHVITSCVIWDDNLRDVKSAVTLQTLNGPVTFTPTTIGKVENASMAMWDWFTSNGAVHFITDFIKPPVI